MLSEWLVSCFPASDEFDLCEENVKYLEVVMDGMVTWWLLFEWHPQNFVVLEKKKEGIIPLTPNDHYSVRTASLTSKRFILYIYSTDISTKYFKHGIFSSFFFSLQNAVCFIILTYLFPVLFTFYIQGVLKLKKKSNVKGLRAITLYDI